LGKLILEGGTDRFTETSSTNSYSERISRSTSKYSEDLTYNMYILYTLSTYTLPHHQ